MEKRVGLGSLARREFLQVAAASAISAGSTVVKASDTSTAARPDEIWGPRIAAQPFDIQPFRAIRIPEWLKDISRYAYSVPDSENYRLAADHGVQMIDIAFGDPFGALFDSKFLARNPQIPADHLTRYVGECKRLGMRVTASIPPGLQVQAWKKHPDWRAVRTNSRDIPEVDLVQNPVGGGLCQMGPWGDFLIEVLAEILSLYPDVDGFGFDGIHTGGICYCVHCRHAYREDAKAEIPDVDLNSAAFRRYQLWLDRRMEAFVERMQKRLRSIKPECALVTWTTNAGRYGHFRDIPRNMSTRMNLLFDAPAQEFWLDETNRGNSIVPAFANAYLWAVTNHRIGFSEPYMMSHGNPYGTDSFPPQEVLRRVLLALTHGSHASISLGFPHHRQSALEGFRQIRRRHDWIVRKTPEPWGAMVMSDQTRVFYGRSSGKVEERYLANVFGMFRASVEEHLGMTVINDWNLNAEDLAPYRVLVLPNTACLGAEQARAIEQYVERGGGVVATVDTSLCDEFGAPRTDFALGSLFGVRYRGGLSSGKGMVEPIDANFAAGLSGDYWEQRRNIFDLAVKRASEIDHPKREEFVGDRAVTFKGQAVAIELRDAATPVAATIAPREAGGQSFPAAVVRRHGEGRVVYLAAGLDAAYYSYAYPYQRLVLAQAIRWAAGRPFGIQVEAPMCVHAGFYRQSLTEGDRLIVHLYNNLNSSGGHAKPDDDVPLREEIVPLHGISVSFHNYRIRRVAWQPDGVELSPDKQGAAWRVKIPPLEIHGMVVAELA